MDYNLVVLILKIIFKDIIESFENAVKDRNEFKIRDKRTADLGLSLEQKTYLFIDAMKATYVKYGLDQVIGAVKAAFKNDYSKFTNGNYLKIILSQKSPKDTSLTPELIEELHGVRDIYGYIHKRFINTPEGLGLMREKFINGIK